MSTYLPKFDCMQRGIDALPGMTILSACLETVSNYFLADLTLIRFESYRSVWTN